MNPHRRLSQALCSAFVLFSSCAQGWSYTPPVENPVGNFMLTAPGDPPSGSPPVTPVTSLLGSYTDNSYLGGTIDLTMDESGKIDAMGSVAGFTDKKEGATLRRTASVKTVNGIPVLTASASASGTYTPSSVPTLVTPSTHTISGSGKVSIPLGPPQTPIGNLLPLTVTNSHTGKQDKESDKDKPGTDVVFLDKAQVQNMTTKTWSMKLIIEEKTDAKGKPYVAASLDLTKPDGSRTLFKPKAVKFSEKNGYTLAFTGGVVLDPNTGQPKPDPKSGKDLIDKKSQVRFSKLMFKKNFGPGPAYVPSWEPAAGGVNYNFLGQKGFGQVFNFDLTTF